jgi:peptidyl-tRNA hydrolase
VESVAVTVTENVPLDAGDPEIAPEAALMVSPEGNPEADQVYGVVPPVAFTVEL